MSSLMVDRDAIAALCRRYGVRRLAMFGSAANETFDQADSDVDFLVEFEQDTTDGFGSYFGLKEDLETLFSRPVDLVMPDALENPYFAESVAASARELYAA